MEESGVGVEIGFVVEGYEGGIGVVVGCRYCIVERNLSEGVDG